MLRNADVDRYRADVHVAVIDVPAFLSVIFGSAAGEGGLPPSKRRPDRLANSPIDWAWKHPRHRRSRVLIGRCWRCRIHPAS
jgi:hypothetical protein